MLTHRWVGGLTPTAARQSRGLDEGWADFYALALLSDPAGDLNGTYPMSAYSTRRWVTDSFEQNYYFGNRQYPYSTDFTKNPRTFRDVAFLDAPPEDPHPGVPGSPLFSSGEYNDSHTIGELWCVALWEARANLIRKHGFTNGNWLMLQLVTTGLRGLYEPNYIQARDAVLWADLMQTGGANALELWSALAKRGLGDGAATTNDAVTESFTIPPFYQASGPIYSSPAFAANGVVYFGASNRLHGVRNDGTNWLAFGGLTTNHAFNSSPAIGPNGVIYAGCNDSNLYAITAAGSVQWATNLGGALFSSPALATDGTIYVGSADGRLYAVNTNGSLKWTSAQTGAAISSSPAVALNGTVYVGSMNGYLYAFNPTNGSVVSGWPVQTGSNVYSSPAIGADGSVYVGSLDGKVYAFTASGGSKSGWPFSTSNAVYSSPAIGPDGAVYVGSYDGRVYAINTNASQRWSYITGSNVWSSPALGQNGTIYVGSDDGSLHVINADGSRRLAIPVGSPIFSSPVIASDGRVYLGSVGGNLYERVWKIVFG